MDPRIYAVGDFTRFSRMYRDALPHARYNPRELGAFVALKVLSQHLDPSTAATAAPRSRVPTAHAVSRAMNASVDGGLSSSSSIVLGSGRHNALSGAHKPQQALPTFSLPRTIFTELPGDLRYLQSTLPKQPDEAHYYSTPPAISVSQSRAAFLAVTDTGVSCCSLKTSHLGVVSELVYLGTGPVEHRNLRHVPGKHESVLNSAAHAYKKGLVPDWIAFFRSEWACALYHDRFPALLRALRESLRSDKGMVMVLSRVFERAENTLENQDVDDFRRGFVGPHGEHLPESTVRTAQAETVAFLKDNRDTLSQYYIGQGNRPAAAV